MPALSPKRQSVSVIPGLKLLNRGKVRDTYELKNGLLLIYATDGLSIFDFVLDALVSEKGMILTAMSHFWLTRIEKDLGIKTHLVAAGVMIDNYLPQSLRGSATLQSRSMIVRKLKMADVEFIARGYLTGSGLKGYQETGTVCGISLPPGLQDGDLLPQPIATPTTKAIDGHDEALDAAVIQEKFSEETRLLLQIYNYVSEVASKKGILFADTKLEFGRDEEGNVVLGDEAATPDSSRYWEASVWSAGRSSEKRKAPPPFDKQLVREEGIKEGINKLNPLLAEDIVKAHRWQVPLVLIEATTQTYRYIFWRLTGMNLEQYLAEVLGIEIEEKKRRLAIIFGSESDIPQVSGALFALSQGEFASGLSNTNVHIISCHRNPEELQMFAASGCMGADVVIAAGSKAFALPGVLDARLHRLGLQIPVIGVALGNEGDIALQAARLSISELPGQPVVMDELCGNNKVYSGNSRFYMALQRAAYGEFPFKKRTTKPARFNVDSSEFVVS